MWRRQGRESSNQYQHSGCEAGCGDLLKDTPYTRYAGTWAFCPPEWICEGQYLGCPATVWSLGILLFNLVCRDLPLHTENDNVYQNLHLVSGLSGGCHDLIWWCLEQDPFSRPTFEEILSHECFMGLPKSNNHKIWKQPSGDEFSSLQKNHILLPTQKKQRLLHP
ncbi:hypothetical protein HF521_016589 [Silurus meridionalis]|uniref:non-specific serine/threonine protein kinase n=1 Tax=Silurus meridionalis TaxID=175797 RepID=A0A8T0BRK3_SILME|nr:hypothetical protein HF521_016589 [Silurus meridionalis]